MLTVLTVVQLSLTPERPVPSNSHKSAPAAARLLPTATQLSFFRLDSVIQAEQVRAAEIQKGVAKIFEWEHDRAARFERVGQHKSYWNDPRIHNFGNTGLRGLLHAFVVPIATAAIDHFAYDGTDARKLLHEAEFSDPDATVVDLCSGVGFSAARTGKVTCVDTSTEMLTVNRLRRPDVNEWVEGNAENYGEADSFDISTMMFATHEMPGGARRRCIRNALRLARHKFMLVDIWPGFEPNDMMLSGEPYVLDYLANIESDVDASFDKMQWEVTRVDVVENHVRMWKFERIDWGI